MNYSFKGLKHALTPFEQIEDWLLAVPCTNCDTVLNYIYRLYRFGSFLYITDIFPAMYENENDCFKRFTSHEGYTVDFRGLATKCQQIFVDEIIKRDKDSVMVVSGSYAPGERAEGESRKLKLYKYIFTPTLQGLNLKSIDLSQMNAFLMYSCQSSLEEKHIIESYITFKQNQSK